MSSQQVDNEPIYHNGKLSAFLERARWEQIAPLVRSGDHVLDLACNEGGLLNYLPKDVHYTGVDISEVAIRRARARFPNQTFQILDIASPSVAVLGTEKFDVITMLAFLEHVDDPGDVLARYAPYLKPDGQIAITTPAPYGRLIHDWGAKIGLFSKQGAEEHKDFLNHATLQAIADKARLELKTYRHFLFGFNQLACFAPRNTTR